MARVVGNIAQHALRACGDATQHCVPLGSVLGPAEAATKFPVTIRWDAQALVAVINGQWTRQDGQIVASYNDLDELRLALELTQMARDTAAKRKKGKKAP